MKIITLLLLLACLLVSCNSGGGGGGSSSDNNPGGGSTTPVPEVPTEPEEPTIPIQPTDTTAPSVPIPLFFISQSGEENELALTTGGEASEISPDTVKIRYYKLLSYNDATPSLALEVSRESFLAKSVLLPLTEGEINYFKLAALDAAGNESAKNSGVTIVSQSTTTLPMPYLNPETQDLNNSATSSSTVLVQGFASLQALTIEVYRDSSLSVKLATVSAASFEESGISLALNPNQVNNFYVVARRQDEISEAVSFMITHDNIRPSVPVLEDSVIADSQELHDLSEEMVDLYGYVDSDTKSVIVYNNSSLEGPGLVFEAESFGALYAFFGTMPLEIGVNNLYFVAVDAAGNRSLEAATVSFTRLSYDVEEEE